MEQLIEAVVAELLRRGFVAFKAFGAGKRPELTGPVVTVGLHRAKGADRAVYEYLGMEERQDGSLHPLYGRALEGELKLLVQCPRRLGGQVCVEESQMVMECIAGPIPGVKLGGFSLEGCRYDSQTDTMQCAILVQAKGYLYAVANTDETEFTDFILKGEVK